MFPEEPYEAFKFRRKGQKEKKIEKKWQVLSSKESMILIDIKEVQHQLHDDKHENGLYFIT